MMLDREACYRALRTRDARFDGRFFIAVRTTGVYCRPVCPARTPRLENVEFHPSAASAQQSGFRPCLRCRPESSPNLAAWQGTSATVSRALALIENGGLDGTAVATLAARLGIGDRQLRRLFQKHLGVTPLAVAQTRRVLFAKQLIHETDMSMIDVALASGFGSVRRFNDTFQKLYGRPPSALRRERSHEGTVGTPRIELRLSYAPPYDWAAVVDFFSARAIHGVEDVSAERYRRTISLGGRHGTVEVRPLANLPALAVTIDFPDLRQLPAIVTRVRSLFDLGADTAAIGAHLSEDPLLAPLVAARPGLRVVGAWDGFELAVRAILGQQIRVSAARGLAEKLVARFGERVATPNPSAPARIGRAGREREAGAEVSPLGLVFPGPERLADADMRQIGLTAARARAVCGLAAAALAEPALFTSERGLEHATGRLEAVPGIGPWTAQYIAMRALREPDAFPAGDVVLMHVVESRSGRATTTSGLERMATAWRPWRAYAAQHLWTAAAGEARATNRAAAAIAG